MSGTASNDPPPRAPRRQSVSVPPSQVTTPQSFPTSALQLDIPTPPSSTLTRRVSLPDTGDLTGLRIQDASTSPSAEAASSLLSGAEPSLQPGQHAPLITAGLRSSSTHNLEPSSDASESSSPTLNDDSWTSRVIDAELRRRVPFHQMELERRIQQLEARAGAIFDGTYYANPGPPNSPYYRGPSGPPRWPDEPAEATPAAAEPVDDTPTTTLDTVQAPTPAVPSLTLGFGAALRRTNTAVADAFTVMSSHQQQQWQAMQSANGSDALDPSPSAVQDFAHFMEPGQFLEYVSIQRARPWQRRVHPGDAIALAAERTTQGLAEELQLFDALTQDIRRAREQDQYDQRFLM